MDVIINKIESIQRCIVRILEEYTDNKVNLENITKQDSIVLNIQRACELSIDMGNFIISKEGYRTPSISRDVFEILKENSAISPDLSLKLQKMVGFRNIAVHDYQRINTDIVESIIKNNIDDFRELINSVIKYMGR